MEDFHSGRTSCGFGLGCRTATDWAPDEEAEKKSEATRSKRRILQINNLSRAPGFFFDGPPLNEVTADMITEAGSIGNADGALRGDFDFRLNNVLDPVALTGGDIAWKRIAGKRRDGNVVHTTDTRLEHAAAPYGNIFGEAVGLNFAGASVAADAPKFDVDDASSVEFDCVYR